MKNFFTILFFLISFLSNNNVIFAEEFLAPEEETPIIILSDPVSISLKIVSGTNSLYEDDISVTACDSDNNSDTPDLLTAYCAILQSGLTSDWNWAWAPGAFANSIGDIAGYTSKDGEGNDVYHYWSWSLNGEYASVGLNQYELEPLDFILLEFIDPIEEEIVINQPEEKRHSSGGTYSGFSKEIGNEVKTFSIEKAVSFLAENQNSNGSFSGDMYTDWVAVGVSKIEEGQLIKEKIKNYLINQDFNTTVISDYERRAMALMALNINPYNETKIDYIEKITNSFDGEQIGDKDIFNDDIFGLIVLQKVGFTKNDQIISKTISNIISKQTLDGSWGSIDMTSAVIMALKNFEEESSVRGSISKAFDYLISQQKDDGGFGNSFSTSWAIQAMSFNDSFQVEVENATKYLTEQQQADGGLDLNDKKESRIWATSYGIPAISKLSWNNILNDFSKSQIVTSHVLIKDQKISKQDSPKLPKIIIEKQILSEPKEISQENLSAGVVNAEIVKNSLGKIIFHEIQSIFTWVWTKISF